MLLMETRTYAQALRAAGLTDEQANVYEPLIKDGPKQAGQLARHAGLSRTYTYHVLEELMALGLVTREEPPNKPALFTPTHPFAVQELARKREEAALVAKQTVEGVMSALISDYTASSNMPGIRIVSGLEGLAELYEDTLREHKDLCLIRSTKDDNDMALAALTLRHIKERAAEGIRTRAITPTNQKGSIDPAARKRDKESLTERRTLPRDSFSLPAQILIYGNKVAITAYGDPLITTIIENPAIHTTMQVIFETLWGIAV